MARAPKKPAAGAKAKATKAAKAAQTARTASAMPRGGPTTGTRQIGAYTATGYRSARVASRDGRATSAASGQIHQQTDRVRLIAQSREFLRDNGLYSGMIERAVGYIVGNGFGLQARGGDKEWQQTAEGLWRRWWRRPEITGLRSGSRVERTVCRELLACGDTAAILTDEDLLQLVEAEQITHTGHPSDIGIETDEFGRPTRYWRCPYNTSGRPDRSAARAFEPASFLYLADPDRPSSLRGVPPAQAAFPMIHRISDVCDSEAVAWQLLARMAVAVTREGGTEQAYPEAKADPAKSSGGSGDVADMVHELDYALIFHGNPGDEIRGIERNLPGANFPEAVRMFLRLMGLPLGLPLEIVLLDWTKSNYSQSVAVLLQAYVTFLGWQMLLEELFYRPIYEWRIERWTEQKELPEVENAAECEWIKPTFPWLDQLKEAQAHGAKVDRGFSTHAAVCKSLGLEREDVVKVREEEVRDAIDRAKRIEKETGTAVPWQMFAGLRPDGPAAGRPGGAEPSDAFRKRTPDETQDDRDDSDEDEPDDEERP